MRTLCLFSMYCLCATLLADANKSMSKEEPPAGITPRISISGFRKIQENLSVLDRNIRNVDKNIVISRQNIKTIEEELTELDTIEKEHRELRGKYAGYLVTAEKEFTKNQKASDRLDKMEGELFRSRDSGGSINAMELDFINRERNDRKMWKEDANAKITRVKESIQAVDKGLKEIESKRGALRGELQSWTDRTEQYQKIQVELTERKAEYERMAKGK